MLSTSAPRQPIGSTGRRRPTQQMFFFFFNAHAVRPPSSIRLPLRPLVSLRACGRRGRAPPPLRPRRPARALRTCDPFSFGGKGAHPPLDGEGRRAGTGWGAQGRCARRRKPHVLRRSWCPVLVDEDVSERGAVVVRRARRGCRAGMRMGWHSRSPEIAGVERPQGLLVGRRKSSRPLAIGERPRGGVCLRGFPLSGPGLASCSRRSAARNGAAAALVIRAPRPG